MITDYYWFGFGPKPMTEHDRIRRDRALACDRNDLEAVRDAVRGLQSTDSPELVPLYDELYRRMIELEAKTP